MKIIVVEDEIRIREGIVKLLHRLDADYQVAGEAENGREGLEMIRERKPDLVITDIRMPELDGLEMLQILYQEQMPVRAIVLSAYSEFEYARQAIRLGVTEYLLKPVALSDFSAAMERVNIQMRESQIRQPAQMGTLEQVFYGILTGNVVVDEELTAYTERKYGIQKDEKISILILYLGADYEVNREPVKKRMQDMLAALSGVKSMALEMAQKQSLVFLFYDYPDESRLERWLQYQVLNSVDRQKMASGWAVAAGPEKVREAFDLLYPYMDWNIALGDGVMISYPKITRVQTSPCVYPVELENRMKAAVCASDTERPAEIADRFHVFFQDGRVYEPKEMKGCYVRFLWAVIDVGKEVGRLDYAGLDQQKLLESVMGARTREELRRAVGFLLSRLIRTGEENMEISHLTVKRAMSMIHEFYRSGITLDEIASKLNITPEYLGTQFHRELGVNFSAYIKNYRIQKAKELLIGTQLKLYEIAEQVGYSDAKYFSRVFKECTGRLPLEYRNTHK